ncbi:hypothetical protein [Streptomyces sp. NBC_00233]|uniref:hypothetical protein n=1 Tax=Streptomyces sp. NBC_00233 TaxID=2975686 RepID=UPI002250666F|nr:hypothetical protein [Streptomyces sp. NBC_00233]MCX5229694.1 hypothetical protein [Streptomyces sp. NBC_00233]
MNIRLPWPRRRPAPAAFPAPAPVPLHTPGTELPPGAVPFDVALRIAREALARHGGANIHSRTAMFYAAGDLDHALRTLVTALDHPQDS